VDKDIALRRSYSFISCSVSVPSFEDMLKMSSSLRRKWQGAPQQGIFYDIGSISKAITGYLSARQYNYYSSGSILAIAKYDGWSGIYTVEKQLVYFTNAFEISDHKRV